MEIEKELAKISQWHNEAKEQHIKDHYDLYARIIVEYEAPNGEQGQYLDKWDGMKK